MSRCCTCGLIITHSLCCISFLVIVFCAVFLSQSVGSVYSPTVCLVTGGNVRSATHSYGPPKYYPEWLVYAPSNKTSGTVSGSKQYDEEEDAKQALGKYPLDTSHACFIQSGSNRMAPLFVWPGSNYLNVPQGRIILWSVLIGLSCPLVVLHMFMLFYTICIERSEAEHDESEQLVTIKVGGGDAKGNNMVTPEEY